MRLDPEISTSLGATSVLMREAKLNFDRNGDPLGVAIVLSGEELEALGVDLDSDAVAYWIEEGELQLEGRSR